MTSPGGADGPPREWIASGMARCPTCKAIVSVEGDGSCGAHHHAPYPNHPRILIRCVGGSAMTSTDAPPREWIPPRREWIAHDVARCPTCHRGVIVANGTLSGHYRYADGAEHGPNQPQDMIQCEGEQP